MSESRASPRKKPRLTQRFIIPLSLRVGHEDSEPAPRATRGPDKQPRKRAEASSSPVRQKSTPTDDVHFTPPSPTSAPSPLPAAPAPAVPATAASTGQSTSRHESVDPERHFDSYASDVQSNTTPFEVVDERTWASARYNPTTELRPVRGLASRTHVI